MANSIHQFEIEGLKDGQINFADYKGKKILLVNVASECGLTPQYRQLQDLYKATKGQIEIVGCPANNFGAQEPGNDEQIASFCSLNYGITFPMTSKISVKGEDMHPLYQFVTQKSQNGVEDSEVKWNFQKYIFNEEGLLQEVIAPTVEPLDDTVLAALGITLDV
ncbi:MAG: glutathione peroxidase [Aureispira sp.]|nr:glutathione peroxidase [Aureispira sp.]